MSVAMGAIAQPASDTLIYNQTLGSAASSFPTANVPNTYRYFRIMLKGKFTTTSTGVNMAVNTNASATAEIFTANGATLTGSTSTSTSAQIGQLGNSNGTGLIICYLSQDNVLEKAFRSVAGMASNPQIVATGGRYNTTAYITTIDVSAGDTFVAGSNLSIWGIS
jgi:hypothetical protein